MRQKFNWIFYLLILMAIPFMAACGGDSDDKQIVDGVRVNNGRKLKEFTINDINYKLTYDSNNKLKSIIASSEYESYDTITIDYERNLFFYKPYRIHSFNFAKFLKKEFYSFVTNEKGLISKIDTYNFSYDEAGRLINIKGSDNFSLMYLNNDLSSFLRTWMDSETTYSISDYKDYGDSEYNFGVTLLGEGHYLYKKTGLNGLGFIVAAMQSGMFGNPPELFRIMSQKNKSTVSVVCDNPDRYDEFKCTFVYD